MILKAVSAKGVLVEKTFVEEDYKSHSDFEQDVRVFIETWDKAGDPLSRVWYDEDVDV
jgi:hypothetical protein